MMTKKFMVFIFTIMILPIFAFSQKAYEVVKYGGKTKNLLVKFILADGYLAGCEIRTINIKTKKKAKFLPENGNAYIENKIRFYHYSTSGNTFNDYFIINGIAESYDSVPTRFLGTYYYNSQTFRVTLTKL